MTNNLQNPDLQSQKTTGQGVLGEGAEKYIRDVANIEDLPGDDDDLEIDDADDDLETVDYEDDVDDVETELAIDDTNIIDDDEDDDYTDTDAANRDLKERGLRS
jgi:hypothetical protein